jgi:hypothetical protein
MKTPSFDYSLDYKNLDLRVHPELYRVGKGEQGVLLVEPYKSEILPFWRFKTPDIANESAKKIYELFCQYKKQGDFVGMDMARKFLQMGYTRSRRYANHSTGIKYSSEKLAAPKPFEHIPDYRSEDNKKHFLVTKTHPIRPQEADAMTSEKAKSAKVFYEYYLRVKNDEEYVAGKKEHQDRNG